MTGKKWLRRAAAQLKVLIWKALLHHAPPKANAIKTFSRIWKFQRVANFFLLNILYYNIFNLIALKNCSSFCLRRKNATITGHFQFSFNWEKMLSSKNFMLWFWSFVDVIQEKQTTIFKSLKTSSKQRKTRKKVLRLSLVEFLVEQG